MLEQQVLSDQDVENLCRDEVAAVLAKHGCCLTAKPVFKATVGGFFGVQVEANIEKVKISIERPDVDLGNVFRNLRTKG